MIKLFLFLLISTSLYAAPKEVEIWFLSNEKISEFQHLLIESPSLSRKVAALECQEMGEYCFDPQVGLYKKDKSAFKVSGSEIEKEKLPPIPVASSIDRNLINCDKNNHFDIFCGKAQKIKNIAKLDLWIDTSSSMREFDFSDKAGGCFRKSFVKRLDARCAFNQKMNVMMFDTSIKEAGSMDQLCQNQGLNDHKRLIDWIERSEAKKLIIITDIYEFHKEVADYIESIHGKIRGDKEPLTASMLLELTDELAKSCK